MTEPYRSDESLDLLIQRAGRWWMRAWHRLSPATARRFWRTLERWSR